MKARLTQLYIVGSPKTGFTGIAEVGTIEGDFNMINSMLTLQAKGYEKKRADFIYRLEHNGQVSYRYNLPAQDYEYAKKLLPDFTPALTNTKPR